MNYESFVKIKPTRVKWNSSNNSISMFGGCFMFLLTFCIMPILGCWLWPYSLNTWLVYLGKEPVVVWWHGALLGIAPFLGKTTIPIAIATWILMLFLK